MEQFRISRALTLSFKCWMRNFIPFTLLALLLQAPLLIWLTNVELDPSYLAEATPSLVPPLLAYRIVQELNGSKVSMWTSMRLGLRGLPPAMLLALVLLFLVKVPVAGAIVAAILLCVYFVVSPAAAAERLGPLKAFPRSADLTRGRRWGICGLSFLLAVIAVPLDFVWSVPTIEPGSSATVASLLLSSMPYRIAHVMFELYFAIVQAVSYALLRQDKDGTSVAELARIFE